VGEMIMMEIPEELDLISVFESIPKRKDETDTFYNETSTFVLENEKELYEITLSPFYNEFTLSVKDRETKEIVSYLELMSVKKIEIVEDKKNHSKIRLFHGESDRYENIIEITLKPNFKLIFREQYR
jgi:hypothetical protein